MRKLFILLIAVSLLSSCSYAFEEAIRNDSEDALPFVSAQERIERSIGSVFIWGGTIVNTVSSERGTYMEVFQTPLNKYGKVVDPSYSEGRFIVYSATPLDPEVHRPGRTLSVAGILVKGIHSTLNSRPYTYPMLESLEIRLWDHIEGNIPSAAFPVGHSTLLPWAGPAAQ